MKVHYEGSEKIAVPASDVWTFMSSPEKVAACLPDVISTTVPDANHFTTVLKVGVGPVRGNFTFQIALDPKRDANQVVVRLDFTG